MGAHPGVCTFLLHSQPLREDDDRRRQRPVRRYPVRSLQCSRPTSTSSSIANARRHFQAARTTTTRRFFAKLAHNFECIIAQPQLCLSHRMNKFGQNRAWRIMKHACYVLFGYCLGTGSPFVSVRLCPIRFIHGWPVLVLCLLRVSSVAVTAAAGSRNRVCREGGCAWLYVGNLSFDTPKDSVRGPI